MCLTAVSNQNLLMMHIRVYVHTHTNFSNSLLAPSLHIWKKNSSGRRVFLSLEKSFGSLFWWVLLSVFT